MAFSAPFSAPQVNWETNDSILAFGKFKQKCELMFKSILKEAEGEEQVSYYILLWVGEQGLDIYNTWTFEDGKDKKDQSIILLPRLRICKFSGNEEFEDRLLDQLIWGTNDPEVQKSLIGRDEKLTLNTAIDIARSYEATKCQMNSLSNQNKGIPSELITLLARN